jgi:drug/metabolite transporter (DMT)-like permease
VLALGIAAAIAASCLYNASIAFQAVEARRVPEEHGLRPSLLVRLLRSRRWLAATALGLAGWPLEVCALLLAPLTVVQPCLASGLVLLLWLGATKLGESPGRREATAVAAIFAGVLGLALAAPARSTDHASAAGLAAALAVVAVPLALPYVLRPTLGRSGIAAAVSAGCGYAWTAIASKLLSDGLAEGAVLAALAWPLTALASEGVALLSEMSALQRSPATRVAPVMFAVQVLIPVALAPLVFDESWSATPGGGAAIVASMALAVAGVVLLAGSKAVGAALETAREPV